ncbi:MAG: YigZ family protein [Candidatus Cloacimonadota bacterium]|nr:MAG: YigZ family protein [Candidatus Cloacimonadota bacterium]
MDFYSVEDERLYEIKIKKSAFICSLKNVKTIEDAKKFISEISSEHKTATHNCWAYIIGDKGETAHSSDNGEPPGTAGKPMLNALMKHHATDIVAVVTRYFGGVKLGIRGLIEAYGTAVEETLSEEPLKKLVKYYNYEIIFDYAFFEIFKHAIKNYKAEIAETEFTDKIKLKLKVEESDNEEIREYLLQHEKAGKLNLNFIGITE